MFGDEFWDITYGSKQDERIVQPRLAHDFDANPQAKKHSCPRQNLLRSSA
jgi:hypothetical protein